VHNPWEGVLFIPMFIGTGEKKRGIIEESMEKRTTPKIPNIPPVQFLNEVISELKKVTWPTRDETMKLTAVVIALSVIVGVFIGGLDAILVQIQSMIFK
jgi:preprotein translocase subunit SecE